MLVKYRGGTLFSVNARGHSITVDLTPEKGGSDRGMSPPELLAAAFGTCIGIYVTQYCKQIGLNCDDTTVDVTFETEEEPLRIGRLHAKVHVPSGIPEERKAAVKKVAEHCLIHTTLCTQPELAIDII